MPDNFFVTAERMYDSSKVLSNANLYHTSCYMAGYVGECYLKLLIENIPLPKVAKKYGHKIVDMQSDILYAFSSGAVPSTFLLYQIDMAVDCPNIYNWSPNHRYDDSMNWKDSVINAAFQQEQDKCFNQITAMYVAGLIP